MSTFENTPAVSETLLGRQKFVEIRHRSKSRTIEHLVFQLWPKQYLIETSQLASIGQKSYDVFFLRMANWIFSASLGRFKLFHFQCVYLRCRSFDGRSEGQQRLVVPEWQGRRARVGGFDGCG